MTTDNRTPQNAVHHSDSPDRGPDLSAMTFFSERRSLFFVALLYFSDSLLIFSGRWITDSAGWIAVIVSGLTASFIVLLCGRIIHSRGVSLLLLILSKIIAAVLIAVSLYLFADFLHRCVSMEIVRWLIPAFIFLTAALAAFKDFSIIKRSASLLAAISIVFLLVSILLLWSRIDFSNIRHLFHGEKSFFSQFFFFTFLFTIKGILLTEILRVENTIGRTGPGIIASGLLFSALLIALIQLISLTVLGDRLYSLIEYPVYYTLGMTKHGDYFERAEIISLAVFMITLTFKCSVLMRIILPHRESGAEQTSSVGRGKNAENTEADPDAKTASVSDMTDMTGRRP